ncbi:hypothetical protein BH23ACT4_BH23ACT4_11890 [soil metagenome]
MKPEQASTLIDSLNWTYANTMPWVPHWYIVRERDLETGRFEDLVRFLRSSGCPGVWGTTPRSTVLEDGRILRGILYRDISEFRYWTMGWPVEEETIVNREDVTTSEVRFVEPPYLGKRPELTGS